MLKMKDVTRVKKDPQAKEGDPEKDSFHGYQMSLFGQFLDNSPEAINKLSNSIELWDATPKYFMTRKAQSKVRKEGGYLDTIVRPFKHRNCEYEVTITPARVYDKKLKKEIEYFPSGREHVVELALRKLSARRGNGFANQYRSGVCFTAGELRDELAATEHTMSYDEVVQSLEILSGCNVVITPLNNKAKIKTSPLSSLVVVSQEDYRSDPKSRWRVDFSTLVTESINSVTYRQHDYRIVMALDDLARYLTLRMSHNWVQAEMTKWYPLKLSTIIRDSCLLASKKSHDNRRKLSRAFEQMILHKRITHVTEHDESRGPKNKMIDLTYHLHPHPDFVKEQKKANARFK
jgi:hypothetical protein